MDVSGVGNANPFQQLWEAQGSPMDGQRGQLKSSGAMDFSQILSDSMSGPNPSNISDRAEKFAELQQLASDDPEKFKATMTEIADKVEIAAAEKSDSFGSQKLLAMADKFRTAAETGDPGQLQQGRPSGVGGPPSGMGGGRPPSGVTGSNGISSQYGISQYMQQVTDTTQSLLDLLFSEDDEEATA